MEFFQDVTRQLWILLDVFIACLLAGAIGYEREVRNKPAGFRTHMIVGGASSLLVGQVLPGSLLFSIDRNLTRCWMLTLSALFRPLLLESVLSERVRS
ncbi:MgtC/SapB family protein [Catalinimonas alkaloidigena]|uniref:MgtC/SapB family protein n=1 Tax=Catalinimonas alkaloidigena TaxID=1075417 RepID=UPI002406C40C|nr:MgtC/SapB family protein [Catalinimonas alkaloidigena]